MWLLQVSVFKVVVVQWIRMQHSFLERLLLLIRTCAAAGKTMAENLPGCPDQT
jgi:hypothetical protein